MERINAAFRAWVLSVLIRAIRGQKSFCQFCLQPRVAREFRVSSYLAFGYWQRRRLFRAQSREGSKHFADIRGIQANAADQKAFCQWTGALFLPIGFSYPPSEFGQEDFLGQKIFGTRQAGPYFLCRNLTRSRFWVFVPEPECRKPLMGFING